VKIKSNGEAKKRRIRENHTVLEGRRDRGAGYDDTVGSRKGGEGCKRSEVLGSWKKVRKGTRKEPGARKERTDGDPSIGGHASSASPLTQRGTQKKKTLPFRTKKDDRIQNHV